MLDTTYYLDWTWDGQKWFQYGKSLGDGSVERQPFTTFEDARSHARPHYAHGPAHFRIETVTRAASCFDEIMVTINANA